MGSGDFSFFVFWRFALGTFGLGEASALSRLGDFRSLGAGDVLFASERSIFACLRAAACAAASPGAAASVSSFLRSLSISLSAVGSLYRLSMVGLYRGFHWYELLLLMADSRVNTRCFVGSRILFIFRKLDLEGFLLIAVACDRADCRLIVDS